MLTLDRRLQDISYEHYVSVYSSHIGGIHSRTWYVDIYNLETVKEYVMLFEKPMVWLDPLGDSARYPLQWVIENIPTDTTI